MGSKGRHRHGAPKVLLDFVTKYVTKLCCKKLTTKYVTKLTTKYETKLVPGLTVSNLATILPIPGSVTLGNYLCILCFMYNIWHI